MKILLIITALLVSSCGNHAPEHSSEKRFRVVRPILQTFVNTLKKPKHVVGESIETLRYSKDYDEIDDLLSNLYGGIDKVRKSYEKEYLQILDSSKAKGIDKVNLLKKLEENYQAWGRETLDDLDHALAANKVYADKKTFEQAAEKIKIGDKPLRSVVPIRHLHKRVEEIITRTKEKLSPIKIKNRQALALTVRTG